MLDRHDLGRKPASTAAWYPEPVPTSRTRSCPSSPSSAQIVATMYGWEIVCPCPIGRAPSSYACSLRSTGTKTSRGTRPTPGGLSSEIPRRRNWPSYHPRSRLGRVDPQPHFARVRSPAKRAAWRPRHAGGQQRDPHGREVSHCGNQREQADQETKHAKVRGNTDAGAATSKRSVDNCSCGQRAQEAADTSGDHLGHIAEGETYDDADRNSDDRADPYSEYVRPEHADEHNPDSEAEPEAQADRVPAAHEGSLERSEGGRPAPAPPPALTYHIAPDLPARKLPSELVHRHKIGRITVSS